MYEIEWLERFELSIQLRLLPVYKACALEASGSHCNDDAQS